MVSYIGRLGDMLLEQSMNKADFSFLSNFWARRYLCLCLKLVFLFEICLENFNFGRILKSWNLVPPVKTCTLFRKKLMGDSPQAQVVGFSLPSAVSTRVPNHWSCNMSSSEMGFMIWVWPSFLLVVPFFFNEKNIWHSFRRQTYPFKGGIACHEGPEKPTISEICYLIAAPHAWKAGCVSQVPCRS